MHGGSSPRAFDDEEPSDQIFRGKPVFYMTHALDNMRERNVTKKQVLRAIQRPSKSGLRVTYVDAERIRKYLSPKKTLDVVFREMKDRIRIVTVWTNTRIW